MLRQNADIAMYRVKNGSKGAAAFFDASMEREALARMKIEQSLRLAILEKRFCCAFQPKVDIRTQEIKGIEALVRLRDDEGVIQAPGTFINLATELGLIDELTHLVLAEIVKSIDLINETFGPDTTISINVAAKQAGNPEFMRPFAEAIEATGFPKRFMIEVTEDAFVTKTHFQDEILPIFRKLGVSISIDDFGIGYSSLSALADITADEIKIDRSFITDIHKRPRSQGILRAIESLSEALGMTVIAEGHRNLRGTGLSAGRDQDPLRPGLLLLEADLPGRPQAGDPARQRGARQPRQPPGAGNPPGLFARRRLSPLTDGTPAADRRLISAGSTAEAAEYRFTLRSLPAEQAIKPWVTGFPNGLWHLRIVCMSPGRRENARSVSPHAGHEGPNRSHRATPCRDDPRPGAVADALRRRCWLRRFSSAPS